MHLNVLDIPSNAVLPIFYRYVWIPLPSPNPTLTSLQAHPSAIYIGPIH